jgi:hypothetical protein
MDPFSVADTLIALDPQQFNGVLQALSARYELGAFRRSLGDEAEWAEKLQNALLDRASTLSIFGRERVTQMVGWTLTERLQERRAEGGGAEDVVQ